MKVVVRPLARINQEKSKPKKAKKNKKKHRKNKKHGRDKDKEKEKTKEDKKKSDAKDAQTENLQGQEVFKEDASTKDTREDQA